MSNIPNELTYLVQNPSGVPLRWEDGSVMQGYVLPANMTFRGVLHPHDLVEVTYPAGFPGYVNVYDVSQIGGPVPSTHVGDGAPGGWGPVIDEPQYCAPGTWWDPARAMCVPFIPPPPPPPAPTSLRTSGAFGAGGLRALVASMFNPAGSALASAIPGGDGGEARVGYGRFMHEHFHQPWHHQSWQYPWHHHHHHHHHPLPPPELPVEDEGGEDGGGYMAGWEGWEGGYEPWREPWHRHHHHHHRPWWESYYTGAAETPAHPMAPTAHPAAPVGHPAQGASMPAHPVQAQTHFAAPAQHPSLAPAHPAHEATHEAHRAASAARGAQQVAHPAAREAARASATHATHAARHARAAQRSRSTREARGHVEQARRHTRMAERHAARAHGYGRAYARPGLQSGLPFPGLFGWGMGGGGEGWGGEGGWGGGWGGWEHRYARGGGFYGQEDVHHHFRHHRAECIQRDPADGACLKERILTPSGRIVFRLTPAGVERMASLENVEQAANDSYAQAQGQPAPGPETGPMPGSEDSGGPSPGSDAGGAASAPDAGSPDMGSPDMGSPDMGAPDMGSPDASAPDQGVSSPGSGAPDLGAGASSPDQGASATSTQGYFAGWDMAFTDPYGRIDPNLPPAWDSAYLYTPAAFAVGVQSGPAIVGVQSGPAIVGVQSGPAIVGAEGGEY